MMTDVVPSPTSSSWVRLSSIIDCSQPNKLTVLESLKTEKLNLKKSTQTRKWCFHKTYSRKQCIAAVCVYHKAISMK